MIKKSDSKSASLATIPILGQPPRFGYFSDCRIVYRNLYHCNGNFNPSNTILNIHLKKIVTSTLKRPRLFFERIHFLKMAADSLFHKTKTAHH